MRILTKRLKEARLLSNWTRSEVARAAGIHQQYVADIENGRRTPSVKLLERLSEIYAVPVYWFFLPEDIEQEVVLKFRLPQTWRSNVETNK